jgi:hypothetical protein
MDKREKQPSGKLRFKDAETAEDKRKIVFTEADKPPDKEPPGKKPFVKTDGKAPDTKTDGKTSAPDADIPDILLDGDMDADYMPDPAGKLKFTKKEKRAAKEKAQTVKLDRKAGKTEAKADKFEKKRDKYHKKQPARKKRVKARYFNEDKGKAKTRLRHEREVIPINEAKWNKPKKKSVPRKAVGAVAIAGVNKLHSKVYEVEHENVGTQAAHKAELIGESAYRGGKRATHSAYRFVRNTPYRREAKFEVKSLKARSKLEYQKALRDNPQLRSNPISRFWQKRNIQKQYTDAIKTAKKSGNTTKKAASVVKKAGETVTKIVRKNPLFVLKAALLLLIVCMLMGLLSMCASIFSGGSAIVGATTYAAEDADMLTAEAAYAGMEAGLQYELNNYAALHPGYDEYHYTLDTIEHDPYTLISIISALHEGVWTIDEVQGTLAMLFERQYILTENVVVETRYRTEWHTSSWTDADGNSHSESYSVQVPYDYYICYVTLENFNLSHLPIYIMGEDSLSRYAMYIATLGNRPDLFPVGAYPNASTIIAPLIYGIPPEYMDDETFAAMITEAEKYLGMPYVWGGYSPKTSFDCSGFVSYVINNSGWNVGRLTAQGLFNICTPVSYANAKPGDLVFFHSTYSAPYPVTHVGIYVGDDMMIHCGNPISYASLSTSYWQSKLYAYGRLPDN